MKDKIKLLLRWVGIFLLCLIVIYLFVFFGGWKLFESGDPILIEGETTAGYFCHLMVDPKDVAKIALEYNYPVWHILEHDYPDGMWEDLGRKFGLATVCSIDL